jgi:hypothetical protein
MRLLGLSLGGAVVIFWTWMNLLLIQRVIEYRSLDQYHRGVIDFLGNHARRERAMGIYKKGRRIGSTYFAMERSTENGQRVFRIEFLTKLSLDLLGLGENLVFDGEAEMDAKMIPRTLKATIVAGGLRIGVDGQRDAGKFLINFKQGESTFPVRFPLEEFLLSDGLVPSIPVAGLKVGETYRVPVFDPVSIFRERSIAEVKVLPADKPRADGIDWLLLETTFRGMTFRSYVTPDGEVLRQEIPPPLDIILIEDQNAAEARRR